MGNSLTYAIPVCLLVDTGVINTHNMDYEYVPVQLHIPLKNIIHKVYIHVLSHAYQHVNTGDYVQCELRYDLGMLKWLLQTANTVQLQENIKINVVRTKHIITNTADCYAYEPDLVFIVGHTYRIDYIYNKNIKYIIQAIPT
jgi:hypothetical protein